MKAHVKNWLFGAPVLRWGGAGMAGWCKENSLSQWQKGGGWTVNLNSGSQSGDDWAAMFVPVNEMPITDMDASKWSWYQTNAEVYGINIVIWLHDPSDFDKRCEVTQSGSASSLEHAAGWNAHEFPSGDAEFFYYGENTTGAGLTAGVNYTWAQFQADTIFKNWVVYRVSYEWGWYSTGTFEDAWLAEVNINGVYIPLKPNEGERAGGETKTLYVATSGTSTTKATAITPAAAKRIRIHQVSMTSASATAANFEVYFDTGDNITSTPANAICIANLDTDVRPSEQFYFGDDGPVGGVGKVVSIRTSADITTNGYFVFVYHEE